MKADHNTIRIIEGLLKRWTDEVNQSDLAEKTKITYTIHPEHFVRWCKDDFAIRGYSARSDHEKN